ncbi:hypothetical protein [Actinomadura rubrisoli]|uniref:Uncharacterized protein n=1 Tax=Actinomadura rubrisoli TaxID=2530368 RepID=A0A4R5CCM1_9ACTN|nr:hypothetical protein [Actinomadura rubrisoli]TDD97205.1 hypothetical protein E1298_01850 [Actinomadura rubrisoli]
MPEINRSHYLAPPAVWADARPEGAREVDRPLDEIGIGALIVFKKDHGNAYKVGSIDVIEDGLVVRFNCHDGVSALHSNPAVAYIGESLTVLVLK